MAKANSPHPLEAVRINNQMNEWLENTLKEMANTPAKQIRKLAIGSLLSLIAMGLLIITSDLENQIVFYSLATIALLAIIYAVPGYIGIWVWRMKSTLFRKDNKQ